MTVRIVIGVPSGDMIHADFMMRLAGVLRNTKLEVSVVNAKSSLITVGRNLIVDEAIRLGATHLMFLDSDMLFPVDVIERLLAHEKDVVGGLYVKRVAPHVIVGQTLNAEGADVDSGILEMAMVPTGCMLINMKVFGSLVKPFFRESIDEESRLIIGEDVYFCQRIRSWGYHVWADIDLSKELAHIGTKAYKIDEDV